jgi:hypothetical protein
MDALLIAGRRDRSSLHSSDSERHDLGETRRNLDWNAVELQADFSGTIRIDTIVQWFRPDASRLIRARKITGDGK